MEFQGREKELMMHHKSELRLQKDIIRENGTIPPRTGQYELSQKEKCLWLQLTKAVKFPVQRWYSRTYEFSLNSKCNRYLVKYL